MCESGVEATLQGGPPSNIAELGLIKCYCFELLDMERGFVEKENIS